MELRIGFDGGRMDRNGEAEAIWSDFAARVEVPFQYFRVRGYAYAAETNEIAYSMIVLPGHPDYSGQEYGQIVLGLRFPDNREERTLTLLHESVHLATFMGSLRPTYEAKAQLVEEYDVAIELVQVAFRLADQIFEAVAELFVREKYPAYAVARARYLANIQRQACADRLWERLSEDTRAYGILGYFLRVDLALRLLSDDDPLMAELSECRSQLHDELRASCASPGVEDQLSSLEETLSPRRDFNTVSEWGPEAYREAVKTILG